MTLPYANMIKSLKEEQETIKNMENYVKKLNK